MDVIADSFAPAIKDFCPTDTQISPKSGADPSALFGTTLVPFGYYFPRLRAQNSAAAAAFLSVKNATFFLEWKRRSVGCKGIKSMERSM
jgi:hypothetical protein